MGGEEKAITAFDMVAVGLLTIACFAVGWATPLGAVFMSVIIAALLLDKFLGGDGSATEGIARSIAAFWRWAFAPIDLASSNSARVWLWRAPASAVIFGFLLRWGVNLASGVA